MGLVQLSAKGKARIIPIAIMIDGKFYDAGSYKASPVPMALDFGVVYEGFRAGVSQGIFTITQPGQLNRNWIAEGKWLPAGAIDPQKKKKYSAPVITEDDKDDRPVLHRRAEKTDTEGGSNKDKDKDKDKDGDNNKDKTAASPAASPTASPAGTSDGAKTADTPAAPSKPSADSSASATDEQIQDPNRPRLRRGKPDKSEQHEPFTTFEPLTDVQATASGTKPDSAAKDTAAGATLVTLIPAVSDAGGPEPRPYTYDIKPAEEAIYRNKMFDLATTLLHSSAGGAGKPTASAEQSKASKSRGKSGGVSKPVFGDVSLRIFDLSGSNEPILVLAAKTRPPAGSSEEPEEITLIARTDLEGELHKLFFSQTDSRHLDVTPRMQLIDAVDADGDGRGELLFRQTSDQGSVYAIYRVTADRLWSLFEGTV